MPVIVLSIIQSVKDEKEPIREAVLKGCKILKLMLF